RSRAPRSAENTGSIDLGESLSHPSAEFLQQGFAKKTSLPAHGLGQGSDRGDDARLLTKAQYPQASQIVHSLSAGKSPRGQIIEQHWSVPAFRNRDRLRLTEINDLCVSIRQQHGVSGQF